MSVQFLTGVPGAGKTYFAVNEISKELAKKSRPIYTNINLKIPYNDYLLPLDVADFYAFLSKELAFFEDYKNLQSQKRKDDPEYDESDNYDEALKVSGILDKYGNAYIVWDECHNDLDRLDPVYVRWLSYHRHFEGMDVLLITQSLDLIERKYRRFADKFLFGQNAAKRLFSTTFKYKVYTDHREYEKYLIETISLASKREIFALYDSGHYKVNRSAAFKKLAPAAALIVFLFVFIKYVFFGILLGSHKPPIEQVPDDQYGLAYPVTTPENDRLSDPDPEYDPAPSDSDLRPPPPMASGPAYQNGSHGSLSRQFVRFQCTQSYCYFAGNRLTIPVVSVERFFDEFGGKILSSEPITKNLLIITAVVPDELYYMIQSHNIVTRSDNYVPNNQNNNNLTVPQFSANSGI